MHFHPPYQRGERKPSFTRGGHRETRGSCKELEIQMTKKSAFFWLVYVSVLFLAIIMQKVERIKTGGRLAQINLEIGEKKARNDYLAFDLSTSKSPQNLIMEAEKRLNLTIPEPDTIIVLEDIIKKNTESKTLIARLLSH